MILECPSCHARYLVQIALFAQGGRQVRCARCKHDWHVALPTSVDVVAPPPAEMPPAPPPPPIADPPRAEEPAARQPAPPSSMPGAVAPSPSFAANLPAVIGRWPLRKCLNYAAGIALFLGATVLWPVFDRNYIVKVVPDLRGFYEGIGLSLEQAGKNLAFDKVKSELRYDGGTMRLYVDGVIHNSSREAQFIPDIKATALGADRRVIQTWWVDAPATTIAAGGDVPFHTEINTSTKRTVEDVSLEFSAQDEKGDASH